MKLLAQTEIPIGTNPLEGIGPLGLEGKTSADAPNLFNKFISNAVGVMTVIAAVWFIFQFIAGAVGWVAAGGDKAKLESARGTMVNGIIGLIIVVAAIFLIEIIGKLIGLDILNPAEFIVNIWK